MTRNTKTNTLIRNIVIFIDFLLMNVAFSIYSQIDETLHGHLNGCSPLLIVLLLNFTMMVAQYFFCTVIHIRRVSSDQVLRQVSLLCLVFLLLSYPVVRLLTLYNNYPSPHAIYLLEFGIPFFIILFISRFFEYFLIRRFRKLGFNRRTILFLGHDEVLVDLYKTLHSNPTTGYNIIGYYGDEVIRECPDNLKRLGTVTDFHQVMSENETIVPVGIDEIYCSISWSRHNEIRNIRKYCDRNVIHFYMIPIHSESFGRIMKVEQIGNVIAFTNVEDPLMRMGNRLIKRVFDIVFSGIILLCLLPFIPIIAAIIKISSPGSIFFRQARTGMNGQSFYCYKFRSMHVNADCDTVQATKNDPRKFAFGNFMRKMNIDELPQFWNVFIGNMSIVGPRPHMLLHTEQYSQLIDKYMIRHFVKPGVTGWAQVTGFRGETKELWQMEGRIKKDIWYIENWSFWLDIRIILMTAKQIFVYDKQAY